jgi:glutaredoxin-like YruB-family protein
MYVTPKRCPKCRYERQPSDTAPDWQCPSCGVAYSKVDSAPPPAAASVRVHGRAPSGSGGIGKWFMIAAVITGLWLGVARPWQAADDGGGLVAQASAEQPEVVMYATSWCGYCAKARAFFQRNGIRYVEYDVERDAAANRAHRELGGRGVPTIVVGEKVVWGYNERQLAQLLGPWME